MDLVHDVDLEAAAGRRVLHVLAESANVVDARVGGGVDLHHVHRRARDEILAGGAGAARFGSFALGAGEGLGEKPRGGGLADASRTREEIGMGDAPGAEGILQRARDRILSHHSLESLRSPLPRQHLIAHTVLLTLAVGGPGDAL